LAIFNVKALVLLHSFDGLALYALEEFFVGRDIVNESNDLTGSPDLWYHQLSNASGPGDNGTYTKIFVTIQEDLATSLAANKLGNLLKLACRAVLLHVHGL
jgi:hypothetical protein